MQETTTVNNIKWDIIRSEGMTHYRTKEDGNPHFPIMANMSTCPGFNFDFMTDSGLNLSFDEMLFTTFAKYIPEVQKGLPKDPNDKEHIFLSICAHFINILLPKI